MSIYAIVPLSLLAMAINQQRFFRATERLVLIKRIERNCNSKDGRFRPILKEFLRESYMNMFLKFFSIYDKVKYSVLFMLKKSLTSLLKEGMVAKIADLGVARILPGLRASTMTKAPGASIYMPPEALEDESRYDVTIDIFSLGVLAIFTLSQTFPKPLAATYVDENDRIVGRSELERRGNYMREVTRQFREGHPLVQMIQRCLKNRMRERPSIQQVMGWLEEARAEVQDGEYDANKLSLAQLLHSRNQQQRLQIDQLQHQIRENRSLREQNESLQAEIVALKQSQEVCVSFVCLLQYSFGFPRCFSRPHPQLPPHNLSLQEPLVSHQ